MKAIRRIFWTLLAIVVIAVLGGIWLLGNVDQQQLLTKATTEIEQKTGYQVSVQGEVGIELWPTLHLVLGETSVTAPAQQKPFLVAEKLHVGVAVMPLLNKQVQVVQLDAASPVIHLERMEAKGNKSATAENTGGSAADSGKKLGGAMFSLPEVELTNATIIWKETQKDGRVEALNVKAALPSLDDKASLKGDVQWKAQKVAFDVTIEQPKGLMEKRGSNVSVTASLPYQTEYKFDGFVNPEGKIVVKGSYDASSRQLRKLLAWLDVAVEGVPADALNQIAASSSIDLNGDALTLGQLQLELDGQKLKGAASLNLASSIPAFNLDLTADALDLRPYMASKSAHYKWGIISSAHAQASGATALPVEMLSSLRGKAVLKTAKLTLPSVELVNVHTTLDAKADKLTLQLHPTDVFDGKVALYTDVTHAGKASQWKTVLKATAVDMKQFLELFQNEASIEGKGNIEATLTAVGANTDALKTSISGPATFLVKDGMIKGMNLLEGIKGLAVAVKPSRAQAWETTEFAELKANAMLTRGVAQFSELFMAGPFLEVQGGGTANLMTTQLDLSLQPFIVEQKTQADGTRAAEKKRAVPLRVTGPWSKAKVVPDVQAELQRSLQDPEKVERRIKNIRDKIKDGGVKDMLDKIF